ncbi:MAG: PAS domain-containing protein [Phycisphaeraceae bacterium]|nr:PAS domain-containing protein [Phycisphaeraceae bacterium]
MNAIVAIWFMIAAACMTLSLIHLTVWLRKRSWFAHLAFACTSTAVAAHAICNLFMMLAQTPAEFGAAMWWLEVTIFMFFVGSVSFVCTYLKVGPIWLASLVVGLRGIMLVWNFFSPYSANFTRIDHLERVRFLGETVSVASGTLSFGRHFGELSEAGLFAFAVYATVVVWRRGDRRRAILVSGSLALFMLIAAGQAWLVFQGVMVAPFYVVPTFIVVISAMGFELGSDVVRAAELTTTVQAREAELRESERQMELASSAARLGLWVWDMVGDDIWIQPNGRKLFGVGRTEQLNWERFLRIVHPQDSDRVQRLVQESIDGDSEYNAEYRIVMADGTIRWIAARGCIDRNSEGKPIRMFGVCLDITERQRAELELATQRDELAHLSRVTMLGELSGSLAHELNQPLASILSNAQAAQRFLARENPDLVEVGDILRDIVGEDRRAGEIIFRLRTLLRKGEVDHQPLDIDALIQDSLRLIRSDLINHSVTCVTECAVSPKMIWGDRVQLQQVLINLVMNACDAMTEIARSERRLVVRSFCEGGSCRIQVVDSGTGVPEDELESVFEAFFTTKSHGMGLGLSVCRTIVSAHQGRLWASNNPDRGLTMHIELPLLTS